MIWGLGKKGGEIKRYKLVVKGQSQKCKFIWSIVNNVVITMYGACRYLKHQGNHSVKYMIL